MQWELVEAVPVMLFPLAFVRHLSIGGLYAAVREARRKRTGVEQEQIVIIRTMGLTNITGAVLPEKKCAAGRTGGKKTGWWHRL